MYDRTATLECGDKQIMFDDVVQPEERQQLGTGAVLWDGAVALARYFTLQFQKSNTHHNGSSAWIRSISIPHDSLPLPLLTKNATSHSSVINILELGAGAYACV